MGAARVLTVQGQDLSLSRSLVWTDLVLEVQPGGQEVLVDPVTGRRWRKLTVMQERIAHHVFEGCMSREACRRAGSGMNPESASGYVSKLLGSSAPFVNYLITLFNEERQSKLVTKESHLQRLDQLSRRAEKEGKYSAAISAEVARGRVAGLYNSPGDEDPKIMDSIKDVEQRIKQLLEKTTREEKQLNASVVYEQAKIPKPPK